MAYSVLVLGEPEDLSLKSYSLKFAQGGEDHGDYDLVIDLRLGKIYFLATGTSIENPGIGLKQAVEEGIRTLSSEEYDPQLAMEMLAGSPELFRNAQRLYASEYGDLSERFEELFSRREFSEMRALAHKVKGYALYAGGKLLQKVAGILETELKENKHGHYRHFLRLHERLLAHCQVENVQEN